MLTLVAAVMGVLWLGVNANRQIGADPAGVAAADQIPARPAADRASRGADRDADRVVFATVDGLELALPHADPVAIGFHEANRVEALELAPVGQLLSNENATRFTAPPDVTGPNYRVLSSRGRSRPATSAVDIVVPLGDQVATPVTGTVTNVTEYPLYGGVQDWRVDIKPEGREDLTVVLIHLLRPSVKVGDSVVAGQTSLAVARLLPFDSHIDYSLDDSKQPHTHIEVKPSVESDPLDPNQPAAPAEVEQTEG